MIYQYIKNIDRTDAFIYVSVVMFIVVFFSRIMIQPYLIVGTIVGLIVVYYLNDKRVSTGQEFITGIQNILENPNMFYKTNPYLSTNSEFVLFLDTMIEYHDYNPMLWKSLVNNINNFLHIQDDIRLGTHEYSKDYELLKALKLKVINVYHSFIYKIPHTDTSNTKFHLGLDKLEILLNTELDTIHRIVVQRSSKGIDNNTIFHYKNHPVPYVRSKDYFI